jgi:hypothetical protein
MGIETALIGSAILGFMGSQEQAGAAESASNLQYQATNEAAKQQREMFDILNAQQAPYRAAGGGALTRISEMMPQLTQVPEGYKPFTSADLQANLAPNYEFMRQQGLGATRQSLNVGGGGSNVERGGIKFAQDYASNAYQNALDNYMKQEAQKFNQQQTGLGNVYNRLAGIAGIGQTATGQTANLGQSTAANIGQLGIGGASALGAGQIGAANAMAGGYQGFGNAATLSSLLRPQAQPSSSGSFVYPTGNMPAPDYSFGSGLSLKT